MFSSSVLLQNTELHVVWKALAHLIFKGVKSSSLWEKAEMYTCIPPFQKLSLGGKKFCAALKKKKQKKTPHHQKKKPRSKYA